MNQNLNKLRNWKTLAVILGAIAVASVMTASSAMAQTSTTPNTTNTPPQIQGSVNLHDLIKSNVKETFIDAANKAVSAVSNGNIIGGRLAIEQGFVVYQFTVVDDKNMIYRVIVDAGNGSVLYTSPGHQMGEGGMLGMGEGMHGHGMHKFHNGGFMQQSQQPPTSDNTSPPTGT
ncbi:hypothetical protein HY212_00530 [Candidatus Pacearchaeota archaeon]|nr:hypothetical protein [Candidatus Pacearchaeota archaeon]